MNKSLVMILSIIFIFTGCENKKNEPEDSYEVMTTKDGNIYRLNKKTGTMFLISGDKIVPLTLVKEKNTEPVLPAAVSKPNNPPEESKIEQQPQLPEQEVQQQPVEFQFQQPSTAETEQIKPQTIPNKNQQVSPLIPEEIPAQLKMNTWYEHHFPGKNLKGILKTRWQDDKLYYEFSVSPYSSLKRMIDKKEDDVYYQRKWHGFIIKLLGKRGKIIEEIPVNLWKMARIFDEKGKFASLEEKGEIEIGFSDYEKIIDYNIVWRLDRILIPDYTFEDKMDDLIETYNWYGEADPRIDLEAPVGAKYWWMTFPDRKKVYFSTEEDLLESYKTTTEKILDKSR